MTIRATGRGVEPFEVQRRRTVADMLAAMARTGSQGRALGEAFELLEEIYSASQTVVIWGLAGSLAPSGQTRIITWLLRHGLIDILVSTGANLSEDLVLSMRGGRFVRAPSNVDDRALYRRGLNRYYDTVGSEKQYVAMTETIAKFYVAVARTAGSARIAFTPRSLIAGLGRWLENDASDSIVKVASQRGVPVYAPGIVDSAFGDAVLLARNRGIEVSIEDAADFVEFMALAPQVSKTAAIYIGGGVPKDFIQTFAATSGLLRGASAHRSGRGRGRVKRRFYPHAYSLQITADAAYWGGSSGASLNEGLSWGKLADDAKAVDCRCDATIALPILAQGLAETVGIRKRAPLPLWIRRERRGSA